MAAGDTTSGTFTGTGTSSALYGRLIYIQLEFSGTATVHVESTLNGTDWTKAAVLTESWVFPFDAGVSAVGSGGANVRLRCTSHTDNVSYWMEVAR